MCRNGEHDWFHNVNRRDGGYLTINGRYFEIVMCLYCRERGIRRHPSKVVFTLRCE